MYYNKYKFGNASSDDFMRIMEEAYGYPLKPFFDQWLRQAGHPIISIKFESESKNRSMVVEQLQDALETWLCNCAQDRAIAIVIDDVHCVDQASGAMLAALARRARGLKLTLIVSSQLTQSKVSKAGALCSCKTRMGSNPYPLKPGDTAIQVLSC